MTFGIFEIITLLLAFAGFGIQPNPKAPTADAALAYAMPDADIVAFVDGASIIPGNYKQLGALASSPQIKSSPELVEIVQKAIGELEGVRGMAKGVSGIDLASDVADATVFLHIIGPDKVQFVLAVHGKFGSANIDRMAKSMSRPATKLGGGSLVADGGDDPSIGVTKDGVLIVGTDALVRERLADGWKAPSHAAGTNLGAIADVLANKPVFAVALTMAAPARQVAIEGIGHAPNFLTDAIKRHKAATFAIFHDGIGWTWNDTTKLGLDDMELVSNGAIDLLRAAQVAPRGFGKIALGAIDSYKGKDKQIDELIKHKVDLQKLMDAYTGDGNFKAQSDKDAKALRLNVRLTGKSVADVVPVGVVLPLFVIGMFESRAVRSMPPQEIAAPPPPVRAAPPSPKSGPAKK